MRNVIIHQRAHRNGSAIHFPPADVVIDGARVTNLKSISVRYEAGKIPVVSVEFVPDSLEVEVEVPRVDGRDAPRKKYASDSEDEE